VLYRLEVPRLDVQDAEASVEEWYVDEGDTLDFGQAICRIVVSKVKRIIRDGSARRVIADGTRGADEVRIVGKTRYVNVVSADVAVLRRIDAPPGAPVQSGTALGLATDEPDESIAGNPTTTLRVAHEPIELRDALFDEMSGDAE
jgi:hypothetical protein